MAACGDRRRTCHLTELVSDVGCHRGADSLVGPMHKLAAGSAPAADVTGLSEYTHCKALWPGSELSNGMGSGVMLAISHMIFGVGRASKRSASSAHKFDLVVAGEVMTGVGDERGGYEILHVGGI